MHGHTVSTPFEPDREDEAVSEIEATLLSRANRSCHHIASSGSGKTTSQPGHEKAHPAQTTEPDARPIRSTAQQQALACLHGRHGAPVWGKGGKHT